MNTLTLTTPFALSTKKDSPTAVGFSSRKGINRPNFVMICRAIDKKFEVGETLSYDLNFVRKSLIKQEDTIIHSIVERAQYPFNDSIYDPKASLDVTEVRKKILSSLMNYQPAHCWFYHTTRSAININTKIWDFYVKDLLPKMVKPGVSTVPTGPRQSVTTLACRLSQGEFTLENLWLKRNSLLHQLSMKLQSKPKMGRS